MFIEAREATQRPIKTLLVEDDPDLVDIAIDLLELTGCQVIPVLSPEEAIESLEFNDDFELLFTDYRFPSAVNGVELANKVTEISPETKVIIATGFDQQSIQSQASTDYQVITKPYRLEAIKNLLQHLFPTIIY